MGFGNGMDLRYCLAVILADGYDFSEALRRTLGLLDPIDQSHGCIERTTFLLRKASAILPPLPQSFLRTSSEVLTT